MRRETLELLTPMLDKARTHELTSSEIYAALKELESVFGTKLRLVVEERDWLYGRRARIEGPDGYGRSTIYQPHRNDEGCIENALLAALEAWTRTSDEAKEG